MRIIGILIVLLLVYDNTRVDAIRAFRSSLRRNEDASAADRSEESDSSTESTNTQASADADLVGSLKDLLSSHQEREKHEQSRLEEVISNNNKLQEELMHKKAELANHAALMAQLEQCLQQTSLVTLGSNTVSNAATTQQAAGNSATPPSSGNAMAGLGGSAIPNAAVVPGAAGAVADAAQIVNNGPATIVSESAPSALPTALYPSAGDVNGPTNNNAGSSPTSLLDTRQRQDNKQPVAPPTHFKMVPRAAFDTAHSIDMWMKASPEQLSAKVKDLVEREEAMSRAEADFKSKQSLLIQQQEAFKTQLKTAQSLKLGSTPTPPLTGHTFNPAIVPDGADSFLQEIGSDIDPAVLRQQIELPPSLRHHPAAPLPFQQHSRRQPKLTIPRTREYITPSYVMAEMRARASPTPTPAAFLDMGETAWKDTRISTDDRSSARLTARVPICVQYTNCSACSADPNCAWCYQPIPVDANVNTTDLIVRSGVCMAHNVNFMQQGSVTAADLHNAAFMQRKRANIMGGGAEVMQLTDALMLGQCLAGQWSSSLTEEQPTFLSFNVFADDENEGTTRVEAIANLILAMSPMPHVVAFQEAEGWFVDCLRKNTALMAVFLYQSNYGDNIAPGGLFILSRKPLTDINYIEKVAPGQNRIDQRPRMLIASLNFDGRDVWVANTCLDWRSSDSRVDALNFIFTTLSPFRDVVLMGDFNFDEGAPDETAHIPFCDGWVDAWTQVNSGLDGHTWDPSSTGNGTYVNSYAHQADPNSQPSRIDRIFLKSTNLKTASMSMVGSSVTSTHFGLLLKAYLFLSQCPA